MGQNDNIQQFVIEMNKIFYCWCWDENENVCLATFARSRPTCRANPCEGDQSNRPGWCPLVPVKHIAIAPGNKKVWVEE